MQAELIGSELSCDGCVIVQGAFDQVKIALVVHPFLELANQTRGEAHQLQAAAPALIRDDVVLGQRRRLLRLVDAQRAVAVAGDADAPERGVLAREAVDHG